MNFCKSGNTPFKNKFWELQITTLWEGSYFDFRIGWTRNRDHAGFYFLVEIHKFMFDFKIYDIRHWNYEKDEYEN